jgi:hypothetical protein
VPIAREPVHVGKDVIEMGPDYDNANGLAK